MKITAVLFLLFTLFNCASAANNTADSLRQLLSSASGRQRIPLLIKLMEKTGQRDPNAAVNYGKEALTLINKFPDDDLKAEIYFGIGWTYNYLHEYDSAKYYAGLAGSTSSSMGEAMKLFIYARTAREQGQTEEALKFADNALQRSEYVPINLRARILNEKGSVLRRLSRYDEAYELHMQALDLLKGKNDFEELRSTYTYLGIVSDIKSRHDEALRYHLAALDIAYTLSDKRSQAAALNNIGIIYFRIEKWDYAIDYLNRALKLWRELKNTSGEAATLNGIGAVYEVKGMYREALNYYKPALRIWEKTDGITSVAIGLQNIGGIYSYLGNYKEASDYLKRAYDIYKQTGDQHGIAGSLNKLAYVYDKLGRTGDAVAAASEGIRISEKIGNWPTIRHAHQTLSEIYENNGRYKEALEEFRKYMAANDTIFNAERQQVIAEMQEKYRSEEQKKQIEILKRDASIQAIHRTYLIAGVVLLSVLLIVIYSRNRLKQRTLQALEMLHENEMETINLRAEAAESKAAVVQAGLDQKIKELNSARELQLSMLPAVIPFHPDLAVAAKMITATEVGGDYYDFHIGEDNSFTIAIGDATGHGARAGIMVTAVKSLFTLLAGSEKIDEILCRSTRSVRQMNFPNIFMAFALMRIKGSELEYAGAGMPPAYIFRSSTGEVEELSLKGLPLGIKIAEKEYQKFSTRLFSGDTVLLTSDGLPELFNDKEEFLGYHRIPLMLKQAGHKPPGEIVDYIINCASEWLNGTPQHDDMTVVVFRKS